jgi:predicted CoA-substrate-specific enzyme activase
MQDPDGYIHRNAGSEEELMFYAGVDAGSNTIKTAILGDEGIVSSHVIKTGLGGDDQALLCLAEACAKARISRDEISCVYGTGYGREYLSFPQARKSEIMCHGAGIHWLLPEVRTIIDIGGQDSKSIRLNEQGEVENFNMNDKCAAGTGRFMETMAHALQIPLEELGECALRAANPVRVSSTCTVFAESEVVSHVARGKNREDILHGVCQSIVDRIAGMVRGIGVMPPVAMTGGVAMNRAVVKLMGDKLGLPILVPPEPQITGALGAALMARRYVLQSRKPPE